MSCPAAKRIKPCALTRSANSVFGVELPNGKLQADAYAAKVPIPVYMPDYLLGDPLALSDLSLPAEEKTKKIGDWLSRHNKDVTQPAVDKIIEGLKQKGIKEIAAIGYCFGALEVFSSCSDRAEADL